MRLRSRGYATAQAELVRRRELSPQELVEAGVRRFEARNPALGAFIHPALERALARAKDPALPDGPFRGVPFAMKDLGGAEAHADMGRVGHYLLRRVREWNDLASTASLALLADD